jgi:hypothetical protein
MHARREILSAGIQAARTQEQVCERINQRLVEDFSY